MTILTPTTKTIISAARLAKDDWNVHVLVYDRTSKSLVDSRFIPHQTFFGVKQVRRSYRESLGY